MATTATTRAVPAAPKGKEIMRWLGPGFLLMVSAAGSGKLLFTPRVGSMYGNSLLAIETVQNKLHCCEVNEGVKK